jgi:APA family basic amino acid/polyamine antiporter
VLLPALGIVTSLGLIYYLPPSSWWRFLAWLGIGAFIYFLYGYRHSRLHHPRVPPSPPTFNPAQGLPPSEL